MVFDVDQKGKFFTEVITKDKVNSHIQMGAYRIRGNVHVRRGDRLSDELNQENKFLAVTNAEIFSQAGELLYITDFLAINRDHIVWLMPLMEQEKQAVGQEMVYGKHDGDS
jgi:hypothetical protein